VALGRGRCRVEPALSGWVGLGQRRPHGLREIFAKIPVKCIDRLRRRGYTSLCSWRVFLLSSLLTFDLAIVGPFLCAKGARPGCASFA
jgi:hypothetical protein